MYEDPNSSKFRSYLKQEPNQYFELKGHPIIIVGMNSKTSPFYDNTAVSYLEEKLADATVKYPNKPIFVFYHVPLTGTVYGSMSSEGWGSNVLQNVVNKYPQVIAFSGHSHFPLGDERSIHQNVFTSVNLGSTTYSEIESGFEGGIHPSKYNEVTEGILVTPVDNDELKNQNKYHKDFKIQRFDTYRKEEIKEPWLVKAPHNGTAFTYKERVGSTPAFLAMAVDVKDITSSTAKVEWSQAKSTNTYDKIHHYEVKVLNDQDVVIQTKKIFSLFYLNSATPTKMTTEVTGLAHSSSYKIQIHAVDSWYSNKSQAIESAVFSTSAYTPDPGVAAPIADLFDIAYTNTKAVNYVSTYSMPVVAGTTAPTYTYNTTLKQYVGTYTTNNQSIHKLDYKGKTEFISKFTDKFSLEIFYKNTSTGNVTPVSSQESGGMGIEQASNGATQLWAHIGTGYKQAGSTKTTQTDYYHMVFTYDGSKIIGYTNGVKVGELAVSGLVNLAPNEAAHWFCIAGDANPSGNAQYSMPGDIVFTRLYSKAVSADEVYRLNEQITKRKALANVSGLQYALTTTIPTKLISAIGADRDTLEALEHEGWNLMRNLGTTDTDIQTFLNKVNALNF